MIKLKPEYAHPGKRFFNGTPFRVVKVKRHLIHPGKIAHAMTFWQVIVESFMERYPWAFIENLAGWFAYKWQSWSRPRFAVALPSTGKRIRVAVKREAQPAWVLLGAKKAQK